MRSVSTSISIAVFFVFASLSLAAAQDIKREIELTQDADYFGFDLRAEKDISLQDCERLCLNDSQCKAFTYNTEAQWCFLKSDFGALNPFEGAVAGKIVVVANEPDIGPAPALGFLGPGQIEQAANMRRDAIAAVRGGSIADVFDLEVSARNAVSTGKPDVATQYLRQYVGNQPDDLDAWINATEIAQQRRDMPGSAWRLREFAISAAINAYQLTRTNSKRAQVLGLLARALENQSSFRPALTAYKRSLELVNSPVLSAAYLDLYRREGFRVTGNTVDTDTASPRACIQFSEPLLKSGVDYGDFVSVDGRNDAAIEAQGSQVCATGLEHGKTYRIAVRAGLPSSVDEVLEEPVVIAAYVRDRAPAIRFSGESFVLPMQARHGVPITGINADSAELSLFRVGARALPELLASSNFLTQLGGYSLERIQTDLGQPVWEGSIELNRERNRETVTSFPVDEVLEAREPGIYVLTGEVSDARSEYWEPKATQWFLVSDIGLTTYAGGDGLTVFARSLDSAEPISGVQLSLLARNNEILGSATSDVSGKVNFAPGLMRGTGGLAPSVLTAKSGDEDFAFLDINRAGFDLSDRGVTGREAPGPIDIYAWTERGIYRTGETVHGMALARDDSAFAETGLPLTVVYRRPDGVEARRIASNQPQEGGYETAYEIPANAMRGVWKMEVYADPDRAPLSEKLFLVEDFKPDRIEFDLIAESQTIKAGEGIRLKVEGRYLYGAPANNLALEGEARLKPVRALEAYPEYQFGLEEDSGEDSRLITYSGLPRTNPIGEAVLDLDLGTLPEVTQPIVADFAIRMREDGGRAVERNLSLPVIRDGALIGVKPDFDGDVQENSAAGFQIIGVDGNGERVALEDLSWSVYRIERNYQWYREGSYWRYESVETPRLVADGTIDVGTDGGASVSANVEWGRYRLDVESAEASGPATSVVFQAGYFSDGDPTETPDAMEVALDKDRYQSGETAILRVVPRFDAQVLVIAGSDRIQEIFTANVPAAGGEIEIPVKGEWGAGVYVTATAFRPGSAQETRMPMRAIGTAWLEVEPDDRELEVALDLPEKIAPDEVLSIPVSATGGVAGEEIYVTVAAVDLGILNLTNYQVPDPVGWYFGQRRLGLEIRDLYGRLIDGSLGAFGRLRSGGDGPGLAAQGSPPTEKLLSLFSGIVKTGEDGSTTIEFDLPPFNGTARVMAVAWSKSSVGSASGDVIIRDPLVMTASLPKVLAPGDQISTVLEIANTDGPAGNYALSVVSSEELSVGSLPATIELAKGERRVLSLPMRAMQPGVADLSITVSNGTDLLVTKQQIVSVRPSTLPVNNRIEVPLAANGGSLTIDGEILGGSIPEGSTVSLNISKTAGFDVASLLMDLDRYPYGCAEQTTSRALPLLYLSEFDAPAELLDTPDIAERINGAIKRVLSYQSSSGSFGLWGPGDDDFWLDAYVSDFLTRAGEKSYDVPEQAMRLALSNLQNKLGYQGDPKENGNEIAYALYVLARNRMASVGDLRYYADTQLDNFSTPLARAQLGAALSLYNEVERSNRVFRSALALAEQSEVRNFLRADYGTPLRDGAAMLALASETRPMTPIVPDMIQLVEAELASKRRTSTQENAWMLLAARAAQDANRDIALEVDGRNVSGAYSTSFGGEDLIAAPIRVINRGGEPLTAVVNALASPRDPLPAGGEGFSIERTYYKLDGSEAQMIEVEQNQRFVVVLSVTEFNEGTSRVLVSDLLPGGFEIDNPRLVSSAQLDGFGWLGEVDAAHTEFRDDRFVAAFNRTRGSGRSFSIAYVVRAVTPGEFTHPAATVENMYRAELSARTATGFVKVDAAQ